MMCLQILFQCHPYQISNSHSINTFRSLMLLVLFGSPKLLGRSGRVSCFPLGCMGKPVVKHLEVELGPTHPKTPAVSVFCLVESKTPPG